MLELRVDGTLLKDGEVVTSASVCPADDPLVRGVALRAVPDTPVTVVQRALERVARCGVGQVDAVVERAVQPTKPSQAPPAGEEGRAAWLEDLHHARPPATRLPPLRTLLGECNVAMEDMEDVPELARPSAYRVLAVRSLTECGCAVDPALAPWVASWGMLPHRFTNVIPVSTAVALTGTTWQEALQQPRGSARTAVPRKPGKEELEAGARRLSEILGTVGEGAPDGE